MRDNLRVVTSHRAPRSSFLAFLEDLFFWGCCVVYGCVVGLAVVAVVLMSAAVWGPRPVGAVLAVVLVGGCWCVGRKRLAWTHVARTVVEQKKASWR